MIDIVFDRFPDPEGANFIEVEDETGASIKLGEWVQRPDGTVAIRIGTTLDGATNEPAPEREAIRDLDAGALNYLDEMNEEGRIEYDDYRNLHDLISAETPTDDVLQDVVEELTPATLDGATNEPAPEYMLSNAGEFAARWNTLTSEQREALWKAMQGACNDGYQCHIRDHTGLEGEWDTLNKKVATAKSELQGLLDSLDSHITHDEIYSAIQAVREVL